MLPVRIDTLEAVDEAYRPLYKGDEDSGYLLEIDDKSYKSKLDEFRNNNRELFNKAKEFEALQEKLAGIDPENLEPEIIKAALEAKQQMQKLEEEGLLKDGKIDEVIERRISAFRKDLNSKMDAKEQAYQQAVKQAEQFKSQLAEAMINLQISGAVSETASVRKGALDDVMHRARRTWSLDTETNELVPRDAKGEVMFGPEGSQMTPQEWAAMLVVEAPHLFEVQEGGGGHGGDDVRGGRISIDGNDPAAGKGRIEDIARGKVDVRI